MKYEHLLSPMTIRGKVYRNRIKKHGAISYLEFCHEGSMAETKDPYVPWGPVAYVREDGVTIEQSGEVIKLEADTCVYSMGMKVDSDALEHLYVLAGDVPVKLIGDCNKVGKLGDAVRGGYMAAMYVGV